MIKDMEKELFIAKMEQKKFNCTKMELDSLFEK
jgi:hypothetical protein